MHSLAEATTQHDEPAMNGYMDAHSRGSSSLSKSEIATCMVGMLIPLLTQVGHVH
jgi:zinc transporter 9